MEPVITSENPVGTKKGTGLGLALAAVALVLCGSSFVAGAWFAGDNGARLGSGSVLNFGKQADYLDKDVDFNLFWQAWKEIKDRSVTDDLKDSTLFYGAMNGLVGALQDPYSVFFDPKAGKEFEESLNGEFEGIGCEIGIKDGVPVVIAPLSDSPAEKAGLRPGDVIMEVDKKDVTMMPLDQIISLIRGEAGTTVTLTVIPNAIARSKERVQVTLKEVPIKRQRIVVKTVKTKEIGEGLSYISINSFNGDTAADFKATVKRELARKPKGLVIDLRNNPGGFVGAAVDVAGFWVGNKTVVTEKGRAPDFPVATPLGSGTLSQVPTVVLVNGGSASASEILAGALKDYGLASIVGEKTYGKGTVQDLISLPDDSLIKLTVAKWYTPNGVNINKEGIVPDVEVKFELPKSHKEGDIAPLSAEEDNQLQKAIQVLQEKLGKTARS